jgi:hypothetical protein
MVHCGGGALGDGPLWGKGLWVIDHCGGGALGDGPLRRRGSGSWSTVGGWSPGSPWGVGRVYLALVSTLPQAFCGIPTEDLPST